MAMSGPGPLGVGDALGRGWDAFTRTWGDLVVVAVVYVLFELPPLLFGPALGDASLSVRMFGDDPVVLARVAMVGLLYQLLVLTPLQVGVLSSTLSAWRGQRPLEGLFVPFRRYLEVLVAAVAMGVAVTAGLVLLVLPGLYLVARWSFTFFLLIDHPHLDAISAMRESWRLSAPHAWPLSGLVAAGLVLSLLGFLLLVVGAFVTVLWVFLAFAAYYEHVTGKPDTKPAPMSPPGWLGADTPTSAPARPLPKD